MSIATAITNAQTRIANAYSAISAKGGTLPAVQNLTNMPTAINSIATASGSVINKNDSGISPLYIWQGTESQYNTTGEYKTWYNWINSSNDVFTLSETPSIGNNVYNTSKEIYKTLNATKVGTITITSDYIATISTTSTKSYMLSSENFIVDNNTWEVGVKINLNNVSDTRFILGDGYVGSESQYSMLVGVGSSKICLLLSSSGSSWWYDGLSTSTIDVNTWYYIKVYFTGSEYKLDVSTDNINWTNYHTVSNSSSIYKKSLPMLFGSNPYNTTASNNMIGSMNMKDCYIKVNDNVLWQGTAAPTISSIDSGTITLSDESVYDRNSTGDEQTEKTIGEIHPDYLCFIDDVGVKIGTTDIADV